MMAAYASVPAGAGPNGPEEKDVGRGMGIGGDTGSVVDPIFDGEEPPERATKRATLLFQFFLFPLLIVVASVGVFLFFGTIGGSDRSPDEYLKGVIAGGENEAKQDAQQLAAQIATERDRVRTKKIELKEAFYASQEFRTRLGKAFEDSFSSEHTLDRKRFLALALGAVGDPGAVPTLVAHLKKQGGADEDLDLRIAIAAALGNLEREEAVPSLAGLATDADEHVANVAVVGLAAVKNDASTAALRVALHDARFEVRVNAAAALARRGVADGLDDLEKTLDPKALKELGIGAEARQAALANAIRGVHALKADRLRPKVAALENDRDEAIRRLVRDVLDAWPVPPNK